MFDKMITPPHPRSLSLFFPRCVDGTAQVLTQVYPDPRNVDDELVESIRIPSLDPNAPEV